MVYVYNTGYGLGHVLCAHFRNKGVTFLMVFMRSVLCMVLSAVYMFNRNPISDVFKSELMMTHL